MAVLSGGLDVDWLVCEEKMTEVSRESPLRVDGERVVVINSLVVEDEVEDPSRLGEIPGQLKS